MVKTLFIIVIYLVCIGNSYARQDTIIVEGVQNLKTNCLGLGSNPKCVINTQDEYLELKTGCNDLPIIDFSKYTLLGHRISGSGCKISNFKTTLIKVDNEYTCITSYDRFGACKRIWRKTIFLLVPKIPFGTDIKFKQVPNIIKKF